MSCLFHTKIFDTQDKTRRDIKLLFFFGTPSAEREAGGNRFINQQDSGSSKKVPFRSGALVSVSIKLMCISEGVPTFHPDHYCTPLKEKVRAKTRSVPIRQCRRLAEHVQSS